MSKRRIVIVGGGHNGLVAAAYLAGAGHRVRLFESRPLVGGATVTEEFHPGFRDSVLSYVVSLLRKEVVDELELKRHGLELLPINGSFHPKLDGSHLFLNGDADHDRAQIAKFSDRDFEAKRRFDAVIETAAEMVSRLMLKPPPALHGSGFSDALGLLKAAIGARRLSPDMRHRLVQFFTTSAGDILDRHFESEAVKLLYAASALPGNLTSLYQAGSAINLLHLAMGNVVGERGAWAYARGGMGAIGEAIASSARQRGAEIHTGQPVREILIEDGRAGGVHLDSGERVAADAVLSSCTPTVTFLKLVGAARLPVDFVRDIEHWRYGSGSLRMSLALDRLPDFTARPGAGDHLRGFVAMVPPIADLERAYRSARDGELPERPMVKFMFPSMVDDTLAPPGRHVASVFCQHYPFRLSGGRSWDEVGEEAADRILEVAAEYAPGIHDAVIARRVVTPLDMERTYGLTGGDVYHGRLDLDQIFSLRPHPAAARYRTPIAGLYLCGAGAHPGGGVTGAPGRNAAMAVSRDLRRGPPAAAGS